MIPEDILKADHCIHDLDELTLKLHNYLTNNPGKPIAFWGYTYQTKKLILDANSYSLTGQTPPSPI